jgi:SAM-dependent methyltransferase
MDPTAVRREADQAETLAANRTWWDQQAQPYYAEHGGFLGDSDFVWGPEGLREADARLLGPLVGRDVLEIGAGAAQCSRWVCRQGARVVATDLSIGMLREGQRIDASAAPGVVPSPAATRLPMLQCDGLALPLADASFDVVFTAYGVIPFVASSATVMREVARVLRPGGRFVCSTTHPFRWTLPDDPGPDGLTVRFSYFDNTPYVEQDSSGRATYVEHHRTIGERVREAVAAGLTVLDLVEPEWPDGHEQVWGGWSPLRGRLIPGTLIMVCERPAQASAAAE